MIRCGQTIFYQKLNGTLPTDPLSNLLELLDTQVFQGPFSGCSVGDFVGGSAFLQLNLSE